MEEPPDLILLDIVMPEMDGFEAMRQIRQLENSDPQRAPIANHQSPVPRIPIIAMTANVMKKDREQVHEVGCDGYIAKPIDIDVLPEQVENFLKGKF